MAPPINRIVRGPDSAAAAITPLRGRGGPELKPDAFARNASTVSVPKPKPAKPEFKPLESIKRIQAAQGFKRLKQSARSAAPKPARSEAPKPSQSRTVQSPDEPSEDPYGLRSIFRPVRDSDFLLSALKSGPSKSDKEKARGTSSARAINARATETLNSLKRFERRARSRVYNKIETTRASIATAFAGPQNPLRELEAAASGRTVCNRIEKLCELQRDEIECIRNFAMSEPRIHQSGSEIVGQRERSPDPMFIASGWACRVRILSGGRRQIIGFLLPGDPIGLRGAAEPDAPTTIGAITQVEAIDARSLLSQVERSNRYPGLERAIQRAEAQEKEFLMNQVARLGAMRPAERLEDLLRELKWRLRQVNLANDMQFQMPLAQRDLTATLNMTGGELKSALKKLRRQHGLRIRRNVAQIAELDGESESKLGFFRPPSISRAPGVSPLPRIISN